MTSVGRRCADGCLRAERLKLVNRSPLLLGSWANLSHGHLNVRVSKNSGQGRKVHV
jgi:hypothetical protein